jgi:hypothetical protein
VLTYKTKLLPSFWPHRVWPSTLSTSSNLIWYLRSLYPSTSYPFPVTISKGAAIVYFAVLFRHWDITIVWESGFTEELAMTEATVPVTTWTHFRVSQSYNLHHLEEDTEDGVKLTSVIRSIFGAHGHRRSAWGRVQSDPQLVVLFSGRQQPSSLCLYFDADKSILSLGKPWCTCKFQLPGRRRTDQCTLNPHLASVSSPNHSRRLRAPVHENNLTRAHPSPPCLLPVSCFWWTAHKSC